MGHLSTVAEHRLEPFRMNPLYEQVDDPRKQIRFVEEVEKQAHNRRETLEREALIRMSKSKGKDKDTLEKAKQVLLLIIACPYICLFSFNEQNKKLDLILMPMLPLLQHLVEKL